MTVVQVLVLVCQVIAVSWFIWLTNQSNKQSKRIADAYIELSKILTIYKKSNDNLRDLLGEYSNLSLELIAKVSSGEITKEELENTKEFLIKMNSEYISKWISK